MVFVVGVGWRCGPGASGGSLGVGFLGGSALGLRPWPGWGIGDSWVLFFWRLHAALLGMPVPADVGCQPGGRTVPGLVRAVYSFSLPSGASAHFSIFKLHIDIEGSREGTS